MINQTINGDDLIANEKDWPSILIISCYLSILSVVGTIGNAFVLYVFSRKKDKSTSTIFILALASIDFVTCVFVIPFTIVMEFMFKKVDNDLACKIYQFFITSNVPFSAFIMTAIAFDRYFCICRPWMKWLDIKFAKRTIVALLCFSLLLGLVTSLAHGVYHVQVISRKETTPPTNGVLNYTLEKMRSENISEEIINGVKNCSLNWHADNINLLNCQSHAHAPSETPSNASIRVSEFVFTGFCLPNEIIISGDLRKIYQKFYASLYLIAFITVFSLYALIYRSILTRRSKKLQTSSALRCSNDSRSLLLTSILTQAANFHDTLTFSDRLNNENLRESKNVDVCCLDVLTSTTIVQTPEYANFSSNGGTPEPKLSNDNQTHSLQNKTVSSNDTAHGQLETPYNNLRVSAVDMKKEVCASVKTNNCLANSNVDKHVSVETETNDKSDITANPQQDCVKLSTFNIYRKDTRKSIREKHRLANIKTAGILFIVTLVFVIAFLPAWLMATKLIPPNMIVFYVYFAYNVANPIIYAFLNRTFQEEMKIVLKCRAISIPFR